MNGKGDKRRPMDVSRAQYEANWDACFGAKRKPRKKRPPKEPYFEHDCLICGQHLRMHYGELHKCPGDRATRTPPATFLPLPNAGYEFGKKLAAAREQAFLDALKGTKP